MMKSLRYARLTCGRLAAVVAGITFLGAAGCGQEPGPDSDFVETTGGAITGGWTTLTPLNDWANFHDASYPPAIGIVNGIVTFRGAIKNTAAMPTNDVAFRLENPSFAPFMPDPAARIMMRTRMRTPLVQVPFTLPFDTNGMLELNPIEFDAMGNTIISMHVHQDGAAPLAVGAAAKNYTSLEGLAFDKSPGTYIPYNATVWHSTYGFRQIESNCPGAVDCGVYVRMTSDGFVRFQGTLFKVDQNNFDGFLFNLPSSPTNFRPGQSVTVPCHLGDPASPTVTTSFGALTINPNGDVFVNGNPPAANRGTSFENVWFSKTNSGNVPLVFAPNSGWHAHSPRPVKVGKYGDVVRFQGAISGGTSSTITTLPAGYAPAKNIRLVAVANGPVPATIFVDTNGVVSVQGPPLSVSSLFLSLDGVSFAR